MKNLSIILFLAVGFVSCGDGGRKEIIDGSDGKGINGIVTPKSRDFEAPELEIGKRICEALEIKRTEFGNLDSSTLHQFRMDSELKKCGAKAYSAGLFVVNVKSDSTDYEYIALGSRPDYFKDVVTDETGIIKTFCTNRRGTNNVPNTMLADNSSYALNLTIKNGYDRYEVTKITKGRIVSTEAVSIITQTSQAKGKHYGVEKDRIRNTVCPNDAKDFSYTKQIWVEAVTGF